MNQLAEKVVWSEGMLLTHQQFQQHDRYIESLVYSQYKINNPINWGINNLKINANYFSQGKFGIEFAAGVFANGIVFNTNENALSPKFIDISKASENIIIYLGLPLNNSNKPDVLVKQNNIDDLVCFKSGTKPVFNYTDVDSNEAQIDVAKLQLKLLTEQDDRSQFLTIPIAKIKSYNEESGIILDDQFIYTVISFHNNFLLKNFSEEILSLLYHRLEQLSQAVNLSNYYHNALHGFLMIQTIHRHLPILEHIQKQCYAHPERLYQQLLQLLGDLSVLNNSYQPLNYPEYHHENLTTTFFPLIQQLRKAINLAVESAAIKLAINTHQNGIKVALIEDVSLIQHCDFILAVRANTSTDKMLQHFPVQSKVASLNKIHDLVNTQVPGIELNVLSVAPPQIPYQAGFIYFKLNKKSQLWNDVKTTNSLAIHISGEFPELDIACWAIRSEA